MTRHAVAIKLLEHGPLTVAQFREITGWSYGLSSRTLVMLAEGGYARRNKYRTYELCRGI